MARLSDRKTLSNEEIEASVEELSRKLEILRVRYEQYFIGVEKVAPSVMRMEVVRLMRDLEQLKIKKTRPSSLSSERSYKSLRAIRRIGIGHCEKSKTAPIKGMSIRRSAKPKGSKKRVLNRRLRGKMRRKRQTTIDRAKR